ncbi:MAG TPA: hypothetical protein VIM65_19815 [Cyclobacteriaceae bacterium]
MKIRIIGLMFIIKCLPALLLITLNTNSVISTTYLLIDFIFTTILYATAFEKQHNELFTVYSFIVTSVALLSVYSDLYFFKDPLLEVVCSGLPYVYSILYFHRLYTAIPKEPLESQFMFWINSGVFIYNGGTIFLVITTSLFTSTFEIKYTTNHLNYFIIIIECIVILIGVSIAGKNKN